MNKKDIELVQEMITLIKTAELSQKGIDAINDLRRDVYGDDAILIDNKPTKWKPEEDEECFVLESVGRIDCIDYDVVDEGEYKRGLIFKTKEEAAAVDALRVFEFKHTYSLEEFERINVADTSYVIGDNEGDDGYSIGEYDSCFLTDKDMLMQEHYPTEAIAKEKCSLLEDLYQSRQ